METLLVAADHCYEDSVEHAIGAHDAAPIDPVLAGLEAAVEMAEADPGGARAGLWRLQADWATLERLESLLGGAPDRTTMRVGAIIHIVRAELAQPSPEPRRLVPEILTWLEGR